MERITGLTPLLKTLTLRRIKAVSCRYIACTSCRSSRTKTKSPSSILPMERIDSWECTAYSTGTSYDIDTLRKHFIKPGGRYTVSTLPKDAKDDLHVLSSDSQDGSENGEIFFFGRYGSFVSWNMTESERINLRHILKQFQKGCYPDELIDKENEQLNYFYTVNNTDLSSGDILLNKDTEEEKKALEKYAFSNAMSLSVKLAMWEVALDTFVDSTSHIPEDLVKGRRLRMSRKMVLQKMGEVLLLRNQINLSSDLLMTPDFYWDRECLEHLYTKTCNYLEVGRRTKRTNEMLNHCSEMIELLRSQLNEQHSSRLELAIIGLIAIEVIIGFNIDWKSFLSRFS